MAQRFYLEVIEGGHRLPVGDWRGYASLDEAKEEAKRRIDDALPNNSVRVYQHVATAYFGGDGEPYVSDTLAGEQS